MRRAREHTGALPCVSMRVSPVFDDMNASFWIFFACFSRTSLLKKSFLLIIPHTASERRQRKYREAGTLNVSQILQDVGAQYCASFDIFGDIGNFLISRYFGGKIAFFVGLFWSLFLET